MSVPSRVRNRELDSDYRDRWDESAAIAARHNASPKHPRPQIGVCVMCGALSYGDLCPPCTRWDETGEWER